MYGALQVLVCLDPTDSSGSPSADLGKGSGSFGAGPGTDPAAAPT